MDITEQACRWQASSCIVEVSMQTAEFRALQGSRPRKSFKDKERIHVPVISSNTF